MHSIYMGYSVSLCAKELLKYFDIDVCREDRRSQFEVDFSVNEYFGFESFEVYGRNDFPGYNFDCNLISKLVPFDLKSEMCDFIDFGFAKSVFFVKVNQVKTLENKNIKLLGPFWIDKFHFEK